MHIIDGKTLALEMQAALKRDIAQLGIKPGLGAVLVGTKEESVKYISTKQRACDSVGITLVLRSLPSDASKADIIAAVNELNANPKIHGIIVQLPLPRAEDTADVLNAIDVHKDADGMTQATRDRLRTGHFDLIPVHCRVVSKILEEMNISPEQKLMAMVVKSPEPYSAFESVFTARGAKTVHIRPDDAELAQKLAQADIIFSLPGQPNLIKREMVKSGALVIDFDYPVASVDFEAIKDIARAITPVPGGCGPLTVAYLLRNTFDLAQQKTLAS